MEGIFALLFPILAIVFGLIGSKNNKDENMETPTPIPQSRRNQQERPINNTEPRRTAMNTSQETKQQETKQQETKQQETYTASTQEMERAEDQFNKQMEMLKKDITSSQPISDLGESKQDQPIQLKSRTRNSTNDKSTMSIRQSLTKSGIREAIIMSEVLAPPKSLSNKRTNRVN
ncbi:putative RND superfamily exporter protein [Gracilibacillus halotolerans]|uniref:Putative RND superfamily exporter protein n=1 Tax=Gracilibacillus halotolerans TaxID=74386 RepID=A0A841RK13_9BACI|nr:hypothetical protein [Gracilibacillus halotolerans]MBB6511826.1 putative RND superfamily exporter protein [Gracilibacillus halotolerans]